MAFLDTDELRIATGHASKVASALAANLFYREHFKTVGDDGEAALESFRALATALGYGLVPIRETLGDAQLERLATAKAYVMDYGKKTLT